MPDSLLNLVTRGRKSDHIPRERRRARLRREFPITEARVPDHCGRKRLVRRGTHARSRRQLRPKQIGMTSASRRQPPVPVAAPQVERWPAQIQTAGSRRVPPRNRKSARLYCKCTPQKMTGTDCGLKRRLPKEKGIAAWKTFFSSYCRAVAARWSRASRSCCGHWWACPDVPGGTRLASTRRRYPGAFASEAALTFEVALAF